MRVSYNVEIKDRSDEFLPKFAKHMAKVMIETQAAAKRYCPVDTGHLRANIFLARRGLLSWVLFDPVEYAAYVEYGTWKMRPQPFFRPAIKMAERKLKNFRL